MDKFKVLIVFIIGLTWFSLFGYVKINITIDIILGVLFFVWLCMGSRMIKIMSQWYDDNEEEY
jgi:hypothetical protein